jgi:hypothetical protein
MWIFDESGDVELRRRNFSRYLQICPDALEEFRLFSRIIERVMCMM